MRSSEERQTGGHPSAPGELVEQARALHRAGNLDAAEGLYREALAQDEEHAEAHQLLAVIAGQRGRFDEAIAGFRRTIALDGPTPDRLYNLAEAYRVSGDFQSALDAYNQTLGIDPSYIDAYQGAAGIAKEAAERARARGDSASAQQMRKLAAHYLLGLGHAHLRVSGVAAAERAYREAVALDSDNAEVHNCLGTIALETARPIEAERFYRRAREIEPRTPLYLNNLGRSLLSQVRVREATECFKQVIASDPTFADARTHLEERILPWLHYRSDLEPRTVSAAHREWGQKEIERAAAIAATPSHYANSRDPDRPLRITYVGLDTSSRLMQSCLEPLIANHDPRQISTAVYVTAGKSVADHRWIRKLTSELRVVGLRRAQEIVKLIHASGTDIMIDLAGHNPHNRLDVFATKPVPLTVTWLGYPDSTGLSNVDYRITDEVSDPEGAEDFYTERLYRLRGGSLAYRPPETTPDIGELPARAPGGVVFGNFDDPRKISPECIGTWSVILEALPDARLILAAPEFADTAFAERVRSDFQNAGIAPERLDLRSTQGELQESLGAYAEVDIALDTFPFNGAPNTICEALWMGVPVISLYGNRPWGRTSGALLAQVGLERIDSHTPEEYAETAIELAQDLDRLRSLRAGMRERMRVSPLMDERGFARRFEAALRDMWRQWCATAA
ncbi:MAG TPA: tetratricopeptide repeat protein [Stellaceae bacterium]|nr:tetratricopeptide repeat protein [Stellaceae bacterium]